MHPPSSGVIMSAMALSARRVHIINQRDSLMELAQITSEDALTPLVRKTALTIKAQSGCRDRDGLCELRAIFDTVKEGNRAVPGLEKGLQYVNDPQTMDYFIRPRKMLEFCQSGACAEDCDSHAALVASLCIALGFRAGLRAYGPGKSGMYSHVYAVALLPKFAVDDVTGQRVSAQDTVYGLDTTVSQSRVGWQPPPGHIMTAWIFGGGITIEGFRRE